MPLFEVQTDGGRNFQIDAPDMNAAMAGLQQHLGQQPAAAPEAPSLSAGETVADILRSAKSGLGRGVIELAGLPAALSSLAAQGSDYAFGSNIGPAAQRFADVAGPAALQRKVEGYTGKFYEPKTTLGGYAQTLGEFAPAVVGGPEGLLARVATRAVLPAIASETAGQLTAGTSAEPYARAAGALVGGVTPAAARRVATPFGVSAERGAALTTLANEGVQVPASMATGSKMLKVAESELGGGQYGANVEQMNQQFTQAALKRAGIDAPRALPEVLNAREDQIGNVFNTVAARNPAIPVPGFDKAAGAIAGDYQRLTGNESPLLNDLRARITPTISGDVYQAISSDIARNLRASSSPELKLALGDMKGALDKAIEGGLSNKADAAIWSQARRDWKNLLLINKAASGTTEAAAGGIITPAALTRAIESMKRGDYVKGRGDFADLARAGNAIMKPYQDSGTASRLAAKAIPSLIAAAATGGFGSLPTIGASLVAPRVAGAVLMSRPVQAYLRNQRFVAPAGGLRRNVGYGVPALVQGSRP